MTYFLFDIRANICTQVGHKKYQFTANGVVVYETDDAQLYDAINGNEEFWDDEDYARAENAADFILSELQDMYGRIRLGLIRRGFESPNTLPTCMDYEHFIDEYCFKNCITNKDDAPRELFGSWTYKQWLDYFKVK